MLTLSPLLHLISFLDTLLISNPLNIVILLVIIKSFDSLLLFIDKVVYNLGYKQPFSFIIKLNIYKTFYI